MHQLSAPLTPDFWRLTPVFMRTVLAVAAEPVEFVGFVRHAGRSFGLQWPIEFRSAVEFDGSRWLLVANGPGPLLAGRAVDIAIGMERVDLLISMGFCGALDPALAVGDIFIASRVHAIERGEAFEARSPDTDRRFASGTLVSMDRVASSCEEKRRLRETGAAAVEMEAAAVAARAREAGLPFYCIRAITDGATESFSLDFNELRDANGRFSRTRILAAAFKRPLVRLPELIALRRRCRVAAEALGDFLADCRF